MKVAFEVSNLLLRMKGMMAQLFEDEDEIGIGIGMHCCWLMVLVKML
jgi:hypothetical protein